MRKSFLSLSVLAVALCFTACKKKDNTPANTAKIMFVHGCAAGATPINLDAKVNGVAVAGAANKAFKQTSGYQNITSGASSISFFVTGLSELVSGSATTVTNSSYTAFAGGSITAPSFVFATDDLAAPASGMAKVRFVNLCPDGLNTSCYVGPAKIDSNVGYKTCTPFYQVAVSSTTVKIAMIDQAVLTNSGQLNAEQLSAGKIYTFVLTGTAAGTGSSALTLTRIGNN